MLRYILLALGFVVLCVLVWSIGPGNIYDAASRLGPSTVLLILIPSVVMYVIEAYGWKVVLGQAAQRVPFLSLLTIRTAGEVVNMTTPGYVAGEPLKAYFLKKYNVPIAEGVASVVIAKTTMTVAQVVFILIGIALGFWILGAGSSAEQTIIAGLLSAGVLVCSMAGFMLLQRRGLFASILSIVSTLGVRIRALDAQEERLRSIDQTIQNFYIHYRGIFYASTVLYFFGWMAEGLEVFAIIYFLDGTATLLSAISIGALAVFIKGGTSFIPGSLGTQEAGNLLLLKAFGYSDVTGITFALLRRFREVVWIGIGLVCLALVGKWGLREDHRADSPS